MKGNTKDIHQGVWGYLLLITRIYTHISRLISEIRFIVTEATRKLIHLYIPVPYSVEMGGKFKGAAYCDIA